MKRRGRIGLAGLSLAVLLGHTQEFDPHDPAIIADGLNWADAVVVGKFGVDWCLPWFDGWHCTGAIHVQESLYGQSKTNDAVRFRWTEPSGPTCLVCDKVSRFHGVTGIWFLQRKGAVWAVSSLGVRWCGEPLPMDCRDDVVQCIGQRGAKR